MDDYTGAFDAALVARLRDRPGWHEVPSLGLNWMVLPALTDDGERLDRLAAVYFADGDAKELDGLVRFGEGASSAPATVHGGALVTVLDDAMGVLAHVVGYRTATASIACAMKRAVPINTCVRVVARVTLEEGRKVHVEGALVSLDTFAVDPPRPGASQPLAERWPPGAVVHCLATAVCVQLSDEQRVRRGELHVSNL